MAFSFGAPAPAAGAAPAPAPAAGGFSFGAPAPAPAAGAAAAPAPAAGGFSFGSPASAAAPGAPAKSPAPAPAAGGFGFGAPAPAPAAPAPAAGGFGFGAPAPAAPAPAAGGLFGASTPAPAPAAGTGLFGAPAPAPAAGGGLFGSTTPAPAPSAFGFGAPTPAPAPTAFGAAPAAAGAASQQQYLTGHTPYASLPPAAKKMVDDIHGLMMKHKKDLATVGSMAPALLHVPHGSAAAMGVGVDAGIAPADMAGGSPARPRPRTASTTNTTTRMSDIDPNRTPLPTQIDVLSAAQRTAAVQLEACLTAATRLKCDAERLAVQGIRYGSWPVEALAARRNVPLSALSTDPPPLSSPLGPPGTPSIKAPGQTQLESSLRTQLLDMAASHVDRIEHLPSPYLWEVLQELEGRAQELANRIDALGRQLYTAELARDGAGVGGVGGVGGGQYHGNGADGTITGVGGSRMLPPLLGMAALGGGDVASGTGIGAGGRGGIGSDLVVYNPNPAVAMAAAIGGHPQSYEEELAAVARQQAEAFLRVAAVVARSHDALDELRGRCRRVAAMRGAADPFELADRREAEEERKVQERIRSEVAVAAGKIGPGAGAGATAGATAGAAPGTPGAAAPAPAAGGGLFGAPAPAPATGGLFGAPAPAPATGGGLFGSTPAPAPATGGLFGAASPAPAPAGGGLFGATPAPAPAAGGGLFGAAPAAPAFGAAPAPATGTVRNKSKTRGTRRR